MTPPVRPNVPLARVALTVVLPVLMLFAGAAPAAATPHRTAFKQGQKSMQRGEWDWAVVHFERAVDLKPDNTEYRSRLSQAKTQASFQHFELAKRHLAAGNLDEAIGELQQTVALNPTHQYAFVELEKALAAWRKQQEAMDVESARMQRMKEEAEMLGTVPKLDPASNVPIQFDLQNQSVEKIFQVITGLSNITVIYDEQVDRNKQASLVTDDVTLEEALDLLMLQQGLAYKVYNEHTIIVYPNNQTKQREYEDQIIRTFYLSNADVKEVNAILRSVIDIRKTAVNEQLNAITILDTQDKIAIAGKLIEANDKAKAELIIDLEILEVNRSKLRQYGIDVQTVVGSSVSPGVRTSIGFDDDTARLNNLRRLNQIGSYVLTGIPSAVINLLRSDSDTRTLSKPQVRVTDGERVTLHLGDQVPIPNTTFNTSNTVGSNVVPVTSYTYQNVGIQVQLEPRIHHNREITLKLVAEISSVSSVSQQGQPTIGTREVDTTIRLRDGEANLLAGLFQEQAQDANSGVPLLTDIPILRRIFGASSKTGSENEIVLTVTPHIVRIPDISVADLAPLQVGTERDRRMRGVSLYGVGGSPFRKPGEEVPADPFSALQPGARQVDRETVVVPDLGLVSGLDPTGAGSASQPLVPASADGARLGGSGMPDDEPLIIDAPPPTDSAEPSTSPATSGPVPAPAARPPSGPAGPAGGAPGATGGATTGSGASQDAARPPSGTTGGSAGTAGSAGPAGPTGPAGPAGSAPAPGPSPTGPVRLSLSALPAGAAVGERVQVDVRIDAGGHEIRHAPLHVAFEPTQVRVDSVVEGDFFERQGATATFIPSVQAGRVIIGASQSSTSLVPATGSGVLATIALTVLSAGDGTLNLGIERAVVQDLAGEALPLVTAGTTLALTGAAP